MAKQNGKVNQSGSRSHESYYSFKRELPTFHRLRINVRSDLLRGFIQRVSRRMHTDISKIKRIKQLQLKGK